LPASLTTLRSRKWSQAPGNIEDLDEYTALQKYISTYRDPKLAQQEEQAANHANSQKKKSWQVRQSLPFCDPANPPMLTSFAVLEEGREGRRGH
jgi:hypothetical protein